MLNDLSKMMEQLKGAEKNVQEAQQRLKTVMVEESSGNKQVNVTVSASYEVKSIKIDPSLTDPEELEDLLIIALNKALKKAHETREKEIAKAGQEGLPNIFN